MATLRRIEPGSAFKVGLLVYLFFGIILAALMVPVMFLVATAAAARIPGATPFTPVMTLPMLLVMPVVYALIGGLTGLIGAAIYNLIAGWVGGLRIELD